MGSPSSWPRGLCGQSPCASLGFLAVPGPSCRLQPQGRAATEPASLEECQHRKGLERSYPSPEFNNRGQEGSERWSDYPRVTQQPSRLRTSCVCLSRLTVASSIGLPWRVGESEGHSSSLAAAFSPAPAACAATGGEADF